jgi:hypothetical protein
VRLLCEQNMFLVDLHCVISSCPLVVRLHVSFSARAMPSEACTLSLLLECTVLTLSGWFSPRAEIKARRAFLTSHFRDLHSGLEDSA